MKQYNLNKRRESIILSNKFELNEKGKGKIVYLKENVENNIMIF